MKIIICFLLLLLIPFIVESYAENRFDYTEAKLEWSQHNFGIVNGTGTAKIILTDFDASNIPNYIDRITVFVYSDSFPEGIDLTLYETEKNSGIFERVFSLSDTRSAPSILYAVEGDTAIVTYFDDTLPSDHEFSEIHLLETTLIGTRGPPLERVPASNAHIVDLFGHSIDIPHVNEQITISSDIANQQDHEQKFAWLTQIVDEDKNTISLAWIDGTLNPETSFSPSVSWIPENEGKYEVTIFVWESLDNPNALSPPISIEFIVLAEESKQEVSDETSTKEHYTIEIFGLKDEYLLGEEYSFYFVISGYGSSCAGYDVRYPDENGNMLGMGTEPLCALNIPLHEFKINHFNMNDYFGNMVIKELGTYTVTVTFDKPNKYYPTTISKEFNVVEK